MVRECAVWLLVSGVVLPAASCSWILDFSDQAIPRDARPDAPYTAAECSYREPNDSLATAAAITPADTGPAAICAGATEDHDFYRFTVPAGTARVTIRISAVYGIGADLDLKLHDAAGVLVARSTGFADEEVLDCVTAGLTCPMLAAGDYVFEVYPGTSDSVNRYTFSLALTAM